MLKVDNLNRKAFLATLAFSEGTYGIGDDGYNVLVGSTEKNPKLFSDYSKHPKVLVKLSSTLSSTAAGRYQILNRIFVVYKNQLKLPDFGKESQDAIALQMLQETKALPLIDEGKISEAFERAKSRWASLPGAGYGQHENKKEKLLAFYQKERARLSKS